MLTTAVHAEKIFFEKPVTDVAPRDVFELTASGEGFEASPDGGGLDISFNSAQIKILTINIDSAWSYATLATLFLILKRSHYLQKNFT